MWFQKVRCGKKVTCDKLYVRSLTQPLTPSQRDWLAESRDAAAWILVRDRFGHEHGLSDYIGPCIPEDPIRHKHAVGVSALQQASMPRERLRSIPKMKLQGSRPSGPESLQSQTRPRTENRLSIRRLHVIHGQLWPAPRVTKMGAFEEMWATLNMFTSGQESEIVGPGVRARAWFRRQAAEGRSTSRANRPAGIPSR